jgi:adenosylmethionine-8-amino-7-oxononanoate aminotransferase
MTNREIPEWQQRAAAHCWMPYTQMLDAELPLAIDSTAGVCLHLADGRTLIDGIASWWTACHGYNHPHIIQAIQRQLEIMPHVMFGGFHHRPALDLAGRLSEILPGDLKRVFFCDSGSVAVEVALKIALQYWLNLGHRQKCKFVTFANAYHGDTTGAMSLCDPQQSMHAKFASILPRHFSLPLPQTDAELADFDRFLKEHRREIAGVVIEPLLQGAGGMRFHSPEALQSIFKLSKQHGLLFIADEIATGFGRTGSMFACEQSEIAPDIICVGKALTGGTISLAATIASNEVFDAFLADDPNFALMHGPTYMANPLACAAANASLDLFQNESRLQQVSMIQEGLQSLLSVCHALPGVVDVRTRGAVGVIQFDKGRDLRGLNSAFVEAGIWLRPLGDVVYFTPAFTIAKQELEFLCETACRVLHEQLNT